MTANELREIMKDSKLDLMRLEETEEVNGGCLPISEVAMNDMEIVKMPFTEIRKPPFRTAGVIAPNYF